MREQYRKTKFRPESRERIEQMIDIVDEYADKDLRLTARQLYYQFVARGLIPNTPAEYKKLTALLTDARYAGLIDWHAIEDRGRVPERASEWPNPQALVESALRAYRLPRWADQPKYVELWVEKQALAGVLEPLAHKYHAVLMVNKGYSSASAMYESAERIKYAVGWDRDRLLDEIRAKPPENDADAARVWGRLWDKLKPAIIFYLGDHDPSGEDMVRDIDTRLREFCLHMINLEVRKIALTMDQVEEYNPPPNPAKMSDSRASGYVRKHGHESWEVDALPPDVLSQLITDAFDAEIDGGKMAAVRAREERDKDMLRKAVVKLK
jgi:hypothetical protein